MIKRGEGGWVVCCVEKKVWVTGGGVGEGWGWG